MHYVSPLLVERHPGMKELKQGRGVGRGATVFFLVGGGSSFLCFFTGFLRFSASFLVLS